MGLVLARGVVLEIKSSRVTAFFRLPGEGLTLGCILFSFVATVERLLRVDFLLSEFVTVFAVEAAMHNLRAFSFPEDIKDVFSTVGGLINFSGTDFTVTDKFFLALVGVLRLL